ncbi:hypothetical protein C8Q70DRAFT_932205 [Cubamyces menziesii]|nr:hypothetical protein C8Q70DRAFT_932205 [Cubamyces menziesii]
MPLFRNYDQPNQLNPRMHIPQALSSKRQYPKAVKELCAQGSETRLPNFPSHCPRCKQVGMFTPRLCYKLGIAGAWALVNRVHIPVQWGPPEKLLERIEKARTEHQQQNNRSSRRRRGRHVAVVAHEPELDNAALERDNTALERDNAALESVGEDDREYSPVPYMDARCPAHDGPPRSFVFDPDKIVCFEAVIWYKSNTAPLKIKLDVPMSFFPRAMCYEFFQWPPGVPMPNRGRIEWWSDSIMQWWRIDHANEFNVCGWDRYVLLRLPGVICMDFARELANMERAKERFAFPRTPVSEALAERVPGYIWAAIWNEDDNGPEMCLLEQTTPGRVIVEHTEAFRKENTGLEGAPYLCYWDKAEKRWYKLERYEPIVVDEDDTLIMLRRPDAKRIRALGDAVLTLEALQNAALAPVVDEPGNEAEGVENDDRRDRGGEEVGRAPGLRSRQYPVICEGGKEVIDLTGDE